MHARTRMRMRTQPNPPTRTLGVSLYTLSRNWYTHSEDLCNNHSHACPYILGVPFDFSRNTHTHLGRVLVYAVQELVYPLGGLEEYDARVDAYAPAGLLRIHSRIGRIHWAHWWLGRAAHSIMTPSDELGKGG